MLETMKNESFPTPKLDNPFWDFSLELWKNEAAQAALLRLQDSYSQNVNSLLFAIWMSVKQGVSISPEVIDKARSISKHWQESIVQNLRNARRALPEDSEIKKSVLKVELEAERIEQALLYELVASLKPESPAHSLEPFFDNLNTVFVASSQKIDEIPSSIIITLVQAGYPELSLEYCQRQYALWSSS